MHPLMVYTGAYNMVNSSIQPLWRIQQYIQELQDLIRQLEFFQSIHTYIEANCTAHYLSKWIHNDITQQFYTHHQLLTEAK